ncbi:GNAT family N-acetyltransferase [Pelomonas sp. Root1217]|uniref:GNAT family N-acetyltransferase n=1 Tax=Pelomonas sp. Root1217 TaxID=1736430 RepID=UPI000A4BDBA0|nr:GNAT family N-acetyltransferase [Pelomonas sp. Root1217]
MTLPSMNPEGDRNTGAFDPAVAARAWANGWAISRRTPAPVRRSGCLQISVGKPGQTTRYVLPALDRHLLQELVTETGPGSWLKICAPRESVSPLLSHHWQVHDAEFLMCTDLMGGDASAPEGYRMQTEKVGEVAFARLIAGSGEIAAGGQVAIEGPFATFDQIVTAEAHRRKGLGRRIMTILSSIALDLEARQGVLVATESGAALYKAMGWSLVSPVTAASYPTAQAG